MRCLRLYLLILGMVAAVGSARADDAWRPSTESTVRLGAPVARLGTPTARSDVVAVAQPLAPEDLGVFRRDAEPVVRTSFRAPSDGLQGRSVGYGPPGGGEEQYNCGVITEGPLPPGGPIPQSQGFWDRLFGGKCSHPWFGGEQQPGCGVPPPPGAGPGWSPFATSMSFRSDHEFDYMISPMTNPFYFEDPRSLTELRSVFIWEPTSNNSPLTWGGNAWTVSFQGRVAINDRWSIVIHRIGFQSISVNGPPPGFPPSPISGGTGITDLQAGPKFTFWRDPTSGTVAAVGANFSIPVGSDKVFQGHGASVTPYLSGAQKLGDFNFMAGTGYRFGFSKETANFLFVSGHVDYNIANKFFPLAEVNWFHYTTNGSLNTGSFEGADLFHTGAAQAKGTDLVTVALGARYKFSESLQMGAAYELPLMGKNDFYRWRLTFDLIFRY